MFQNEDTSSIENSRPPTGAPKAEATPAAAPAEMKLRLFEKFSTPTLTFSISFTEKKTTPRYQSIVSTISNIIKGKSNGS